MKLSTVALLALVTAVTAFDFDFCPNYIFNELDLAGLPGSVSLYDGNPETCVKLLDTVKDVKSLFWSPVGHYTESPSNVVSKNGPVKVTTSLCIAVQANLPEYIATNNIMVWKPQPAWIAIKRNSSDIPMRPKFNCMGINRDQLDHVSTDMTLTRENTVGVNEGVKFWDHQCPPMWVWDEEKRKCVLAFK